MLQGTGASGARGDAGHASVPRAGAVVHEDEQELVDTTLELVAGLQSETEHEHARVTLEELEEVAAAHPTWTELEIATCYARAVYAISWDADPEPIIDRGMGIGGRTDRPVVSAMFEALLLGGDTEPGEWIDRVARCAVAVEAADDQPMWMARCRNAVGVALVFHGLGELADDQFVAGLAVGDDALGRRMSWALRNNRQMLLLDDLFRMLMLDRLDDASERLARSDVQCAVLPSFTEEERRLFDLRSEAMRLLVDAGHDRTAAVAAATERSSGLVENARCEVARALVHDRLRDGDLEDASHWLGRVDEDRGWSRRHRVEVDLWLEGRIAAGRIGPAAGPLVDVATRVRRQLDEQRVIHLGAVRARMGAELLVAERRRLEREVVEDHLTGLGNRRAFDRALAGVAEGDTLVLLDIDRFKPVNDAHGHDVGDALLVGIAQLLVEHVRADDTVCRIGGDEFALVMRGAPTRAVQERCAAIRAAVAELEGPADEQVSTSLSIGTVRVGDAPDAYVAADRALYAAKRAGGDRVVHGPLDDGDVADADVPDGEGSSERRGASDAWSVGEDGPSQDGGPGVGPAS